MMASFESFEYVHRIRGYVHGQNENEIAKRFENTNPKVKKISIKIHNIEKSAKVFVSPFSQSYHHQHGV